ALGQQRVELVLAEHRAQRGLRELARRVEEVHHLDDRFARVDDAEVDHRVHLDRDVVARDHVLRRHVEHHGAQVDAHRLLDSGDDEDDPRSEHALEAAEEEDHRALVLAQDPDRHHREDDENYDYAADETDHRSISTLSTRPSIPDTRSRSPRRTGALLRTRQVSPCTRAHPSFSKSSIASACAPIICSRPVTTGLLRLRTIMPATRNRNAALATATPPMRP